MGAKLIPRDFTLQITSHHLQLRKLQHKPSFRHIVVFEFDGRHLVVLRAFHAQDFSLRRSRGKDIEAACGQVVNKGMSDWRLVLTTPSHVILLTNNGRNTLVTPLSYKEIQRSLSSLDEEKQKGKMAGMQGIALKSGEGFGRSIY